MRACPGNGPLHSPLPHFHPHEGQRNVPKWTGWPPGYALLTATCTECLRPSSRSQRGCCRATRRSESCPLRGGAVPCPTRRTFTRRCRCSRTSRIRIRIRRGIPRHGIRDRQYFRVRVGLGGGPGAISSPSFSSWIHPTFERWGQVQGCDELQWPAGGCMRGIPDGRGT